ncbi:DEAD/DEAH box helicase [Granulicoccus phenolivorans]|uniref:DEAD/DEAH box helicase n=1 Tax=Granulicoccus phenolivorans TaxID=266854 RepID=UPI00041BD20B|nr:DEAD/DEAH box helicase [Granulicoccus phenolivorans]
MAELLPTQQARQLSRALVDYLATTFALTDPDAQRALEEFLHDEADGIFTGPYVRLKLPFAHAADGWQHALEWLPTGFEPYAHQAAAFARLTSHPGPGEDLRTGQPTLVTTGTGSGKTEAFLYPVLDHVLRARRLGHPGIKALILYPMNALANDQADRITRLLTTDPRLRGVTAALYTGEQGATRTRVSADGLITDRNVIRDTPPDVLLTNYKMLDQLLLRPEDHRLWQASADSLRYLVLDEFHTYDGAQGTDVAMLLRRLGLVLDRYRAEPTAPGGAPLGPIIPVATSATLGDAGDTAAMRSFAESVFGVPFVADAVITETRRDLTEWADELSAHVPAGTVGTVHLGDMADAAAGLDALRDPAALTRAVVEVFLEPALAGETAYRPETAADLAGVLLAAPQVRNLIETAGPARDLDDLVRAMIPRPDAGGVAARFVGHLIAALSHLRAELGRGFVSVETHLWIREVTRIDRDASAVPRYRWGDDGIRTGESGTEPATGYPALYCRHCGRSGWGIVLEPTGTGLARTDLNIRRHRAAGEKYFRALLYAPSEAAAATDAGAPDRASEGLHWWHVSDRRLESAPPDEFDTKLQEGQILPVLTHTRAQEDQAGAETCPSCGERDAIRWLGSAISTLLSVTLSALFGDQEIDASEKKALVFTDSVQDAAHRAGFVQARSHTLSLRSTIHDALSVPDGAEPDAAEPVVSLAELPDRMIERAGDDPFRRYRLLPPNLADAPKFADYWKHPGRHTPAVLNRVRTRLAFDLALEFGLNSRFGRTLENTGSAVAGVDAGRPADLVTVARAALATMPALTAEPTDRDVIGWVRGVLEHLRSHGAIDHRWLHRFIESDGNRWLIWGGRNRSAGMPAFPRGRSAPQFPRVGAPVHRRADMLLEPVTGEQSWHAQWAVRALGVPASVGAVAARQLLAELATAEVLLARTTDSNATAYALDPARILVRATPTTPAAAGEYLLRCDVCHTQHPGDPETVSQLAGRPCMYVRCPGHLHPEPIRDNYYRDLYASTDMRRVVAREHTSLLPDEVRLEYEDQFRRAETTPGAPNVLVATPTLELGIDIGDLSTVLLAALPRTVASYLQRVGRAGRLTGNALNLAYVTGRPQELPRLHDPDQLLNGAVRPPAIWLSAEEILRRQYLAALIDRIAGDPGRRHPRTATEALAVAEPDTFLGDLIAYAETHAAELLDAFLGTFADLQPDGVRALRGWASAGEQPGSSGLARQVYAAAHDWNSHGEALEYRRQAIATELPELQRRAEEPHADGESVAAYQTARGALNYLIRQLKERRSQHWVAALEEAGLLPNYTLLDDSVALDVTLTWRDPETDAWQEEQTTLARPSARALHEFAPGAHFYARGFEVEIDCVELGPDADAIREWRFCAECGWAREEATADPDTPLTHCPRCGSPSPAGMEQRLPVAELTRVSARASREEARIGDRAEDRVRTRFTVAAAVDIDPARVGREWFVDGYDFGARYLDKLTVRWLNLGRTGSGATLDLAGRQYKAPLFRICTGCGVLDRAAGTNRPEEHRPWCRYRKNPDEEHVATIALSRTLTTQGVLLSLPPRVTYGDTFAIPSLTAALLLGMRETYGGDPDHLGVLTCPAPSATGTREALLLHDLVPGGTGYLADLASPDRAWDLLYTAWERVRDCPCRNEGQLACHRCLLPYAEPGQAQLVSRMVAERHLRAILTAGNPDAEPDRQQQWATTTQQQAFDVDAESHLEQRFRIEFTKLVESLGPTDLTELPGPSGNRIRFRLPNQEGAWLLEPQVLLGRARPDFVLSHPDPQRGNVAIFTDGYAYHASVQHNRLADDAAKRSELTHRVLAVTADDVAAQAAGTPARIPGWWNPRFREMLTQHFPHLSGALATIPQGPFGWLRHWLTTPDTARGDDLADALALGVLAANQTTAPGGLPGPEVARRLVSGGTAPGPDRAGWWSRPGVGIFSRPLSGSTFETCAILDDRPTALADPGAKEAWQDWLAWANAIGFDPGHPITTTQLLSRAPVAPPVPAAVAVGTVDLGAWAEVLDEYVDDRTRALVVDLSRTPVPVGELGYETEDENQIVVDLAWPEERVAVVIDPDSAEMDQLRAAGWTVVEPSPDAITHALAAAGSNPGGL